MAFSDGISCFKPSLLLRWLFCASVKVDFYLFPAVFLTIYIHLISLKCSGLLFALLPFPYPSFRGEKLWFFYKNKGAHSLSSPFIAGTEREDADRCPCQINGTTSKRKRNPFLHRKDAKSVQNKISDNFSGRNVKFLFTLRSFFVKIRGIEKP